VGQGYPPGMSASQTAPGNPADDEPEFQRRADRRQLLVATGAAATIGLAALGGPATSTSRVASVQARKRVQWRLASSFPASLEAMFGAAEVLSARVAAMTDGAFEIKVYQAGELTPALQVMDGVEKATFEVGQTAGYYYKGKNPALVFDTCVPFGLNPRQQQAWLIQGGGLELVRRLYADFGILNFAAGNTGVQMGGWFRTRVDSAADLRGLKMRIPGLGGDVMDALGVVVQVLGGADIYPALERGTIDATEWVGPFDDEKLGFHKVAKHYYYPGWWEPGPELSFMVNRDAFDALPSDYRAVFETATREAAGWMQSKYDQENPRALSRLVAQGVDLRAFPDDLMREARDASEQLLADKGAGDATYAELLDQWRKFRAESFAWFGTAERAYAEFAFKG
jgi:TRAP-type mannitol/chloroaromatic compound transport system substrate-binding protein